MGLACKTLKTNGSQWEVGSVIYLCYINSVFSYYRLEDKVSPLYGNSF